MGLASVVKNLFAELPPDLPQEVFEDLVISENIRIERIISQGHVSPEGEWYDQDENEWVVVLQGSGKILFANGKEVCLEVGDCLNIPAHQRHRVSWTDPDTITLWLAVFYK
jgi:cupin 2 domain-containing protein